MSCQLYENMREYTMAVANESLQPFTQHNRSVECQLNWLKLATKIGLWQQHTHTFFFT